jgi:hypothetical protein
LESFRGDFKELGAVMMDSWGQNQDQALLYDEPVLRSAFAYPGACFDLAPTIYIDGRLAAFVAAFPRTVRVHGRDQRLACITFWTTAREFKGRGFGSRVWMEILRRAAQSGYDGAVNFCVDGALSNSVVKTCGHRAGAEVCRVFTATYLARLLRPSAVTEAEINPDVVDGFLNAAEQIPDSVSMVRLWSRAEAEWQCVHRQGALCAMHEAGSRIGVVTGYISDVIGKTPTKVLLLEDLLWGNLTADERSALLEQLLALGAAAGAQLAVVPIMRYAETDTLRRMGFRESRRLMHTYLTVWGGKSPPQSLSSLYLDVF